MSEPFQPLPQRKQEVGTSVLDAAFAVHRTLGPGLLESTYELCLEHELRQRGHETLRQVALPVVYDTIKLEGGYRIDLMVDGVVIIEVKSVEALAPIHEAQVLTYLRLSSRRLGYLINFNVALLKQGIRRMIL
jgi:GxxExxY protein